MVAFLMVNSSDTKIIHCNISDNSVNMGGIYIEDCSNIYVTNSIIRHCGTGISISQSNLIFISNCDFYLNTHYAISMRLASNNITITKCDIKSNLRYGLYIEKDNYCNINENNIFNHSIYGIYSKDGNCNAQYNWWGSAL